MTRDYNVEGIRFRTHGNEESEGKGERPIDKWHDSEEVYRPSKKWITRAVVAGAALLLLEGLYMLNAYLQPDIEAWWVWAEWIIICGMFWFVGKVA